ncbi:MAG: TolC family protein [Prevotella sp.]|nr:TolC family protein [Prevotella sp.]
MRSLSIAFRPTTVLLGLLFLSLSAYGQGTWTLTQCIEHAVSHNISIQQNQNQLQQQQIQLSNARNQRLPDVSASANQNFSFGRGLTVDNTYANRSTSSTSFSLGASMPLFTGFRIPNNVALNQLNLKAVTADLEKAKNDIRMQVAQAYVQILYNMEISDVAHRQIAIDSAQEVRVQALLNVGKASEAQLAQQQATLAQSRLTATQADNNTQLSLLTLSQLLELPSPDGFTIVRPNIATEGEASAQSALFAVNSPIPTPDAIYAEAMSSRPEVEAALLRLRMADKNISIAKADYYPTLSLSAGMGSNYYKTSGFTADPFHTQLKNNFSQYIGLNLNVPIFSRFQTRNSVRSARIDYMNQQLTLDNTKKQLYKEIQQAYYNTTAAQQKLTSSEQARESSAAAFRLMTAKYEQGKATITEFNEAKNTYLKTESDLTQARYEYLYQTALIQFYRGQELKF